MATGAVVEEGHQLIADQARNERIYGDHAPSRGGRRRLHSLQLEGFGLMFQKLAQMISLIMSSLV